MLIRFTLAETSTQRSRLAGRSERAAARGWREAVMGTHEADGTSSAGTAEVEKELVATAPS